MECPEINPKYDRHDFSWGFQFGARLKNYENPIHG